ncbi:hypothetical protein CWI39_0169p0030 [Hamiltosporidium magnivora]|uniref:Uncharacterized protein n=1 Tax=Hamiltosporidium magnivora TaxID=148818 RepID=A0A4Q9LJX8_9MICR|nr:hypothetical protein CWI39_0169p0030 [Hamiltosporidium magnivora]
MIVSVGKSKEHIKKRIYFEVFRIFDELSILQRDNWSKFVDNTTEELYGIWPGFQIIMKNPDILKVMGASIVCILRCLNMHFACLENNNRINSRKDYVYSDYGNYAHRCEKTVFYMIPVMKKVKSIENVFKDLKVISMGRNNLKSVEESAVQIVSDKIATGKNYKE